MSIVRKAKEYLEGDRIYYKIVGDDRIHTITPLTYGLLKHKIFTKESLKWGSTIERIKDNIEYIHFYKSANYGSYSAGPNTVVDITVSKGHYKDLYIEDSENVTLRIVDGDNCVFNSKIKQATKIEYSGNTGSTDSIEILGANYTSIHTNGNAVKFHNLKIDSRLLEIYNTKIAVYNSFVYNGDKLRLADVQGIIPYQFVHTARVVTENTQIEANTGHYDMPVRFGLKNSALTFSSSLCLGEVTLENKDGIMLTENTVDTIEKSVRDYEKKKRKKETAAEKKVAKVEEEIKSTSSLLANALANLEQEKQKIYATTSKDLKKAEQKIMKKYRGCIGSNSVKK